jgi:beta-N-acetylhexosaminidase
MDEVDPGPGVTMAWSAFRLVAEDMRALGINTVCAPVLDLPVAGAHSIIGDRAFGRGPVDAAALAGGVAAGLLNGGVLPVMKHIPGHGRARADSHFELPVVETPRDELERTDFAPFRALNDMPAAMTAHVVFTAIDPDAPASTSAKVTAEVIRGNISFDGLLMSDDLGMKALRGTMAERAAAVIAAGSDVALHCSGDLDEMRAAAGAVPWLTGESLRRLQACFRRLDFVQPFDVADAEARLAKVLAADSGAESV